MKNIIIYLFMIVMLAGSCEMEDRLDIDLPEGDPVPVVEAYLLANESLQLLYFQSTSLQEPVRINLLWNTPVYIIRGEDSLSLRNIIKLDRESAYMYNYLHDSLVSPDASEYRLFIDSEEYGPITAVSRPAGKVDIEEVNYDGSLLEIHSRNLEQASYNYYKMRLYEFRGDSILNIHQAELDLSREGEGEVLITYPLPGIDCDSIRVDLYRIDSAAYNYHRSISNALGANRDPFTTPVPFSGNVENAWGIFTCVSRASRMMYY
ncbi:MAG: DUF4249 family protein [Bacteroidales bacterium]